MEPIKPQDKEKLLKSLSLAEIEEYENLLVKRFSVQLTQEENIRLQELHDKLKT